MRICILTQPLHINYGGLLQAYALQKVLKDMGHEVTTARDGAIRPIRMPKRILRFCTHYFKRNVLGKKKYNPYRYLLKSRDKNIAIDKATSINTSRFLDNNISTIEYFKKCSRPTNDMITRFDAIVVGSDQVWRYKYSYAPSYFLDFTEGYDILRIVYAASFGLDNIDEYPRKVLEKCKQSIKKLDAISVREDSAEGILKKVFGVDALHVLDPTMLLDKDDYLQHIEEEDKEERQKVLMTYVLDKTKSKSDLIKQIAGKLELNPMEVSAKEIYNIRIENDVNNCIAPSVSKWIAGFRDADFVVTDSFHGTIFSIIFNKPFITIVNDERGATRFTSLMKIFGLEDRMIKSELEIDEKLFAPIDYDNINKVREKWKQKSLSFLTNSLKIV